MFVAAALCVGACADDEVTEVEERIFGGEGAIDGPYRAVFSLHLRVAETEGEFGSSACTGTLIAPYAILTAAHCVATVDDDGDLWVLSPEEIRVDNKEWQPNHDPPAGLGVVEIVVHPDWDLSLRNFDLAVLRLDGDGMQLSDGHLIRIASEITGADVGVDGGIDLVGYGDNNIEQVVIGPNLPTTGLRRHVPHSLRSIGCSAFSHCQAGDPKLAWSQDPDAGICFGDSGGPVLMFRDEDGNAIARPPSPPGNLMLPDGARLEIAAVATGATADCEPGEGYGNRTDGLGGWLAPYVADLDGDGVVDFNDFLIFSPDLGRGGTAADFDNDGIVAFPDFLYLAGAFGR